MDSYIKGEVLGEGTFGVVFKATHKEVCQEHTRLQMQHCLQGQCFINPPPLMLIDRPGRCH